MTRDGLRWGRDTAPIVLSAIGAVAALAVLALLGIAVLAVPWG
jgi:hypothetical protein